MPSRVSGTWLAGALSAILASAAAAQAPSAGPPLERAGGHPDLNGAWSSHPLAFFLQPVKDAKGNVCIVACTPAPAGGAQPGFAKTATGQPLPQPPMADFPPYKPELMAKVQKLKKNQVSADPALRCGNPGLPRIGPPSRIVQTPQEIAFLYDDANGSFWRLIPIDRPHRDDAEDNLLGDSVGRWDGETLVVEATHFNDASWLTDNGAFHSDKLKVTERFTPAGGAIRYEVTVEDPEVLAKPWVKQPRTLSREKSDPLEPPPCVEQSFKHMATFDSYHTNPR